MKLNVKLFADGADKGGMLEMYSNPLISGFTTNPTLMKVAGVKDYRVFAFDILNSFKDKPISFEVFGDDYYSMLDQALKIKTWGKNIYVKVPVINSKGKFSGKIINELNKKNIKINLINIFYSYFHKFIRIIAYWI